MRRSPPHRARPPHAHQLRGLRLEQAQRRRRRRRTPVLALLGVAAAGTLAALGAWLLPLEGGSDPSRLDRATVTARRPTAADVDSASGAQRSPSTRAQPNRTSGAAPGPLSVYAHDHAGMLSPIVRRDPARIYVPNSESNTVDVIDPRSYRVVARFAVGALPQHVTPSYDLKTLYVLDDAGNSLTPLDPRSGNPRGKPIPVADPYNLYFTPGGRFAIVVAERERRLDFRDPSTMALRRALPVPCSGVDHMDFSADGAYAIASCEFSSELVKIDVRRPRVLGSLRLASGSASPQDVKLSADGRIFYVADKNRNGVWLLDGRRLRVVGFLHTGPGAHGLYVSRDARDLYVTNRDAGTISVVSFRRRRVVATWRIPGGGSPDMGGVSADGRTLWLTGRYNGVVYAIDTRTGRLRAKIPVGAGPHGLAVWPQPGRHSLGHTGVMR